MNVQDRLSSYHSKRETFVAALSSSSSNALREILSHCVITTDLCMVTYLNFAESLKASAEFLRQQDIACRQRQADSEAAMAAMKSVAQLPGVEDSKNSQLAMALALNQSLGQTAQLNYLLASTIQTSTSLTENALFEGILKSDDLNYASKAVAALLHLLIDLTPIGGFKGALQSLASVVNLRSEAVKAADGYHAFLEDYQSAAYNWCILTELLNHHLRNLAEPCSISMEQAAEIVQKNFTALLQNNETQTES